MNKKNQKMNTSNTPKWLIPITAVGLLWNVMGIFNFITQMTLTPEALAQYSEVEQMLIESTPLLSNIAFAIGVFGGTLGCVGILLLKKWSRPLLQLSLVAVLLQMSYWVFFTEAVAVYGPTTYVFPTIVILVAYGLYRIARNGESKGYLR